MIAKRLVWIIVRRHAIILVLEVAIIHAKVHVKVDVLVDARVVASENVLVAPVRALEPAQAPAR